MLGVSLAVARAAADSVALPLWRYLGGVQARVLPTPLMNIVNGGVHADSGLEVQEFMIVPAGFPDFEEALRAGTEIFHTLKKKQPEGPRGLQSPSATRRGFAPKLASNERPSPTSFVRSKRPVTSRAKTSLSRSTARRASSSTSRAGKYTFDPNGAWRAKSSSASMRMLTQKCTPSLSIEDSLLRKTTGTVWKLLTDRLGAAQFQLVGDDLFVTNVERLRRGIDGRFANAILIKLNQIGTLTETPRLHSSRDRRELPLGHQPHRSGGDRGTAFIADLAVGTDCGQIKTGSLSRSDRVAKYNLAPPRIAFELRGSAVYAGRNPFRK